MLLYFLGLSGYMMTCELTGDVVWVYLMDLALATELASQMEGPKILISPHFVARGNFQMK